MLRVAFSACQISLKVFHNAYLLFLSAYRKIFVFMHVSHPPIFSSIDFRYIAYKAEKILVFSLKIPKMPVFRASFRRVMASFLLVLASFRTYLFYIFAPWPFCLIRPSSEPKNSLQKAFFRAFPEAETALLY